jgi:DNA-binding response OmpR family regulator
MMPRMVGSALVLAMRAHPKLSAVPVLIITGTKGRRFDGVPAIVKPVTAAALLAKVASLLEASSSAVAG